MMEWVRKQKELLDIENCEEAALLKEKLSSMSGKACENEGLSILNLEMIGIETILFGRSSVELQKIGKLVLPSGIKVGDEVDLSSPNRPEIEPLFGLVKKITPTSISIVLDEYDILCAEVPLRINLHPSSKTHVKMMEALDALGAHPLPLSDLLYSSYSSISNSSSSSGSISNSNLLDVKASDNRIHRWCSSTLNPSQQQAIETAMRAKQIALIHGPPGTGKTSTLVELILQAILKQQRILVTAPSNIAVDTILIRLTMALEDAIAHTSTRKAGTSSDTLDDNNSTKNGMSELEILTNAKRNLVRLGHPARIHAITQQYSLDCRISMDEDTEIVQDVKKELNDLRISMSRAGRQRYNTNRSDASAENNSSTSTAGTDGANNVPPTKREMRQELKSMRQELQQREQVIVQRILAQASVTFATCIGASSHMLTPLPYDLVIVDEAAQALEAATWIPLLRAGHFQPNSPFAYHQSTHHASSRRKKVASFADVGQRYGGKIVLAGDHCQLPPTVKSDLAAEQGLSVTLFERIMHFSNTTTNTAGAVSANNSSSSSSGSSNDRYFESVITMLNIQYRMHERINAWASRAMYHNQLQAHVSVKHHSLLDLLQPEEAKSVGEDHDAELDCPPTMLFIDTSGTGMHEEIPPNPTSNNTTNSTSTTKGASASSSSNSYSHRNVHEAAILIDHLVRLLKRYPLSLSCRHIGLITPYNGQVQCLKSMIAENVFLQGRRDIEELEVKTVDGFQGGEKEVILFSFVRSTDSASNTSGIVKSRVGFLKDSRRINVAVTRTKRHFVSVGDRRTIGTDRFVRQLIEHIEDFGDLVSVEEFQQDVGDGLEGGKDGGCSLRSIHRPEDEMELANPHPGSITNESNSVESSSVVGKSNNSEKKAKEKNKTKKSAAVAGAMTANTTNNNSSTKGKIISSVDEKAREEDKEKHRVIIQALLAAFVSTTVSLSQLEAQCQRFSDMIYIHQLHQQKGNSSSISSSGVDKRAISFVTVTDRGCALHFSTQLSSFHRMLIHEVSDTFLATSGTNERLLRHRSVGEGDERRLEVWVISSLAKQLSILRSSKEEEKIETKEQPTQKNMKEGAVPTTLEKSTTVRDEASGGLEKKEEEENVDEEEEEEEEETTEGTKVANSNANSKKKKNKKKANKAGANTPVPPVLPTTSTNPIMTSLTAIAHLERQRQKQLFQQEQARKAKERDAALQKAATEDDFLDIMIAQNQQDAELRKHRLGNVRPMPNYEKEYAKEKLRAKLDASQGARRPVLTEEEQRQLHNNKKKVVKKPPPNFGGGRLGSG